MKTNYKISMDYNDYIIYHEQITGIDLQSEGNSIIFYTNKETINFLDMNNINYIIETNLKDKIKSFLIFKKFIFVSILFLLFSLYLNTYRVQDVVFNIDTPINYIIEQRINASNKKVLFFDFNKIDYQQLAKDLRSEYPCYEWISITKDYDVVEVEIIKTGLDNTYSDNLDGDIVASKSGTIVSYLVHSGDILIEKNINVNKGDVLIKGSYYDTVVSPKGIVLANTFDIETYKIYKEDKNDELTSKSNSFYEFNIINNIFDLNNQIYTDYNIIHNEIFKIPFIFTLSKVTHLELKEVVYYYDEQSAIDYAKSKSIENFNLNKTLDEEMIDSLIHYKTVEKDEYYEISILVKKIESIGVFKQSI